MRRVPRRAARDAGSCGTDAGPFGPTRYACAEHRGDLTAYLREHYGTLGWHPWKMPPYPITRRSRDTDRALRLRALSPGSSWGPRA